VADSGREERITNLLAAGRYQSAEELILALPPEEVNDRMAFNFAIAKIGQAKYGEARRILRELMRKGTDIPLIPLAMGQVSEKMGQKETALHYYKMASEIEETHKEAQEALEGMSPQEEVDDKSERIVKLKPVKPETKFKDVMGYESIKDYLKERIILAMTEPELFKKHGKKRGLGLMLYGAPGCLVGGERIIMADGTIEKIQDFGEYHLQAINKKVQQGVGKVQYRTPQPAMKFHKYEHEHTIEIITETGKSIKGTDNHPLLMANKKYVGKRTFRDPIKHQLHTIDWYRSSSEWKRLDEIKVGDRVRTVMSYPSYKKSLVISNFNPITQHFRGKLPKTITPALGGLFGYIIGDGTVDRDGYSISCVIAEDEIDLLPKLSRIIKDEFGINPSQDKSTIKSSRIIENGIERTINRTMQMTFLRMNSKDISYNLRFLKEKRVPSMIFKSNNTVVCEFLKWLFTADGHVQSKDRGGTNRISLKSIHIELLRDVQLLLLRFGIHARIHQDKPAVTLNIQRGNDILKYKEKIGFACNKKIHRLEELVAIIPNLNRHFKNKQNEKVIEVRDNGFATVYDLEVPTSHRFIANGIISHNCGKSYISGAIAGEANAYFLVARIPQILGSFVGSSEKNLSQVFKQARANTPCIVFFDEFDALGTKRSAFSASDQIGGGTTMRLIVNTFLSEMNGVEKNPEGIFVIAATNLPYQIDPAIKRSGRIGDFLYLKPPTYRERKQLIGYYLKGKTFRHINVGRIARATIGYSCADIERMVDEATLQPIRTEHKTKQGQYLRTSNILLEAFKKKSTLESWYFDTRREVIGSWTTEIQQGKKMRSWKQGILEPEEKELYKELIQDVQWNTKASVRAIKQFIRLFSIFFI
jgi:SpoVK/Ycf46/Vps4 family AAA+-type ATPase/intein/homing endonuclease